MKGSILALTLIMAVLLSVGVGYSSNVAATVKTEVEDVDVGVTQVANNIDMIVNYEAVNPFSDVLVPEMELKSETLKDSFAEKITPQTGWTACNRCEAPLDPGLSYNINSKFIQLKTNLNGTSAINVANTNTNLIRYLIC